MGRNNRNKILVPEARQELDELKAKVMGTNNPEDAKIEVANELGIPLKKGYNGGLTSAEVGKVGGKIGGNMVKELVKMAQESLKNNQSN
ncbi:MAG: alpha/beta-type small acid-soluble spore protein [Solibacillus sp.]|uniref:alpha/beta-type small acid-soluble spore protein n=1 Tax=unclassified Solibacillus TaxID=2637870 RepID=UPI0030F6B2A2